MLSLALEMTADLHHHHNVISLDNNIDLILAGRTKKQSYVIPSVPIVNGRRQRKLIMNDLEFENLMGEVTGERYDYPCRPEIEILTIGHANNEEHHQNILYNSATCLFILTSKIEDNMISQLHEKGKELHVVAGIVKVGKVASNSLNDTTQRIFRRFIREDYLPILQNEAKLKEIVDRVVTRQHHIEGGNSDSETSEDSVEEKVKQKKPKRFSKVKSGLSGRPTSASRPNSGTRASGSGPAMLAARDAAARNRLLSSVSKSKKNLTGDSKK